MSNPLKLALAQVMGSPFPKDNLETARNLCAEATERGAEIVVFPEMFMSLPRKSLSLADVAEPIDGPFVTSLGTLAKTLRLHIIAGIWERIPGKTRVRNAAVMLSPKGKTLTAYRKLHLFNALNIRESDFMIAGKEPPEVVPVNDFKIATAICYDLRFPELFRDLAFRGADLVIIPSAWYSGPLKEDHWLTLLRARAIENTSYVAGVNLAGSDFCGRSAVFDPFGIPKAEAGEGTELLVVELEHSRLSEVRSKLPVLQHCRTGIFEGAP